MHKPRKHVLDFIHTHKATFIFTHGDETLVAHSFSYRTSTMNVRWHVADTCPCFFRDLCRRKAGLLRGCVCWMAGWLNNYWIACLSTVHVLPRCHTHKARAYRETTNNKHRSEEPLFSFFSLCGKGKNRFLSPARNLFCLLT